MAKLKTDKLKNNYLMIDHDDKWYRSKFWFSVVIGFISIGVFVLMGSPSREWINSAVRVAPLILVAGGIDMIFFRRSPVLGGLWGIITMMGFVYLALLSLNHGWGEPVELVTESYSYPIGNHDAYNLTLSGGLADVNLTALPANQALLLDGTINHYGNVNVTTNTTGLTANITIQDDTVNLFPKNNSQSAGWILALNPELPLALNIDGGIGTMTLDLSSMNLRDSRFSVGIGNITLNLPDAEESYRIDITGGIGEFTLHIPNNTAIRLEAQSGIGSLNVNGLERIGTSESNPIGDEGIWQSPGFDSAEIRIIISYDGGIGSLNVVN